MTRRYEPTHQENGRPRRDFSDRWAQIEQAREYQERSRRDEIEHPSVGTFFRTTILLLTLAAIPTAAVYREKLPTLWEKATLAAQRVVNQQIGSKIEHTANIETQPEETATLETATLETAPPTPATNFAADGTNPLAADTFEPMTADTESYDFSTEQISAPVLQKLERLGALNGRLRSWGSDGQWWRYTCRVRPRQGAGFVKEFEAVGSSPEAVATAVLEKIERWQNDTRSVVPWAAIEPKLPF